MNTTARFQLHVPRTLPNGEPVSWKASTEIEEAIHEIGSGFTVHTGTGSWKDDEGRIHEEAVSVYTFDVADGYRAGPQVQNLARKIARDLDQKAVYVTWTPTNGSFVTA